MRRQRTNIRLLVAATALAVMSALGLGTLAQAQAPTQAPAAKADKRLGPPPSAADMAYFDQFMVLRPDGKMHVDGTKVRLPKGGPDGEPLRDKNGKILLFPLDDGSRPPITPGTPEAAAAAAQAAAEGRTTTEPPR